MEMQKNYYAAQPTQQTVTTGQQIIDLQGQSYATAIDAAIAKSKEFSKALKGWEKFWCNLPLNKSFKLTESEIEAIKKKYPQLSKKDG